ncbi:glycosyltransferase family 9 protein [Thermovibrio sp.]
MRALLIRFSSLGDVILVSSLLRPLRERGIEIELLTFKPFGELFYNQPGLKKVIEVEKEELRSLEGIKKLGERLKGYDFALDLHNTLRTRILKSSLNFPVYTYRKRSILRRLMVLFKPFKAKWLFVPELYGEVLKKVGIEEKKFRPELKVDKEALKRVKELVKGKTVVIAPGARWESKAYPIEKFCKVSEILTNKGYRVIAVGGKEEKDKGEELKKFGALNLCGELSLRESLALISLTKGVISNDSAVVHMARAVKTPVLSIFGPTHPALGFAPYEDEGRALTLNLPCSPCSLHGKTRCKERKCFKIPPERVVKEFEEILRGRS